MISYNTDGVKMPAIRRRDTSAWIKQVAAAYGKKVGNEMNTSLCFSQIKGRNTSVFPFPI